MKRKLDIIKPEKPFDEYVKGYVSVNREGRKIIQLYKPSKRRTISFARYLLSVKLGRELTENEEADHRDNNNQNDDIDNLQVLSREQNLLKQAELQKVPLVLSECPECLISFALLPSDYKERSLNYTRDPFCSRSCASRNAIKTGRSPSIAQMQGSDAVPLERINMMLKMRQVGMSSRKIGKELGFDKSTVNRNLKRYSEIQIR